MINQEAIETIKIAIAEIEWNYPLNYAVAFETAIEALEKQIPKKPLPENKYYGNGKCPSCNAVFLDKYSKDEYIKEMECGENG